MADYGADITYASYPDYDDWGWDNYWGCTDWQIWYTKLEEFYGSVEARQRWKSAWEKQDATSNTWKCLYNDSFRNFVEENQLGVESYTADVVTGAQGVVTNIFGSAAWLSKNLKWILPLGLVVVGVGYLALQGGKLKGAADLSKLVK